MKKNAGIWIDVEKAMIFFEETKEVVTIPSEISEVFPPSGSHGKTGIGGKDIKPSDSLDRKLEKFRHLYYKELMERIKDRNSVYILGPGEVKTEFANYLRQNGMAEKVKGVHPADKLTQNQLVAKFTEIFV